MEGEEEGETLETTNLEGERDKLGSEKEPCLIIVEISLDFSMFSAAIGALKIRARIVEGEKVDRMKEKKESKKLS